MMTSRHQESKRNEPPPKRAGRTFNEKYTKEKERKGDDRYPRKRRIAYRPIRARDDISYFLLGWRFYLLVLRKALQEGKPQRDIDLFLAFYCLGAKRQESDHWGI
jgi:hypothetical protein